MLWQPFNYRHFTFIHFVAVPSQGPSSITVSSKTDSSIDISWTAVPQRHANGIIIGYKVLYQQADIYESPKVIKVSSQALGAKISGLHGFTRYTIRVRSSSKSALFII